MVPGEFDSLLDALAEAGYAGIEAMIAAPYALPAGTLRQRLSERGLQLIGVRTGGIVEQRHLYLSSADPMVRMRAVSALCEVIEYGAEFGQPKILLGLMQGRLEADVALGDALGWIAEGLAHAGEVAARLGLEIGLEPINRFILGYNSTVSAVLALIQRIGADNVRLLVDTFHMHIEERSIAGALFEGGARIGHVHLADSNRRAPGLGHFDFAEFFGTLRALGYTGDLTVECEYWPNQIVAARMAAGFLSSIVGGGW
jgi:sugar phosphate isomerase/epimerase